MMGTQDMVLYIIAAFGPVRSSEVYRATKRADATISRAIACLLKSGEIAPLQLTDGDTSRAGRWWVAR